MKVQRLIAKRWKALQDRDDLFAPAAGEPPWPTVCLTGLNGSGKTTYLEVIADLWALLRSWARQQQARNLGEPFGEAWYGDEELARQGLSAMLVRDLPGPAPSLWIVHGSRELWRQVEREPNVPAVGVLMERSGWWAEGEDCEGLAQYWDAQVLGLEAGARDATTLPNVILLGSEDRYVLPLENATIGRPEPEPLFQWLHRYLPTRDTRGHLENSLSALLLTDRAKFVELSRLLQRAWPAMELLPAVDRRTLRPRFRLPGGTQIEMADLSSGERSMLVILTTVARWLARGGVVLIDEPELHLHLSMQRTLLIYLEQLVHELDGQLIVASHAPSVWDHFYRGRGIIELGAANAREAAA